MKIVKVTCPNCGGKLNIDADKKAYCDYCGTPIILDDEVQHVQIDDAEETGYKFEKGRLRAQEEKQQEERERYLRNEQEKRRRLEEQKAIQRQQQLKSANENPGTKKNASKVVLIVTLVLLGVVLFFIIFCCFGMGFLAKMSDTSTQQGNNTSILLPSESKVESINEIDDDFVSELKNLADTEVNNLIKETSLDVTDYKDILELGDYLGYCFAYDETLGNEIFFVYQINNKTVTVDNVNLRTFSDERSIYYYVGYKDIVKKGDGSFGYNETKDAPTETVSDFTGKNTYVNNFHIFSHPGYPFVSSLFDDLESRYTSVEYNPGKDAMINAVHQDKVNITNYSDNSPHCAPMWFDEEYTDESGESYKECLYAYNHSAFSDPICLDYRIGSEYDKLSFTCGTWPGKYGPNSSVFIRVIDKDTFDVIYESESLVANQSINIDLDVSTHKNIRIQFVQVSQTIDYPIIKDVILSD